MLWARIPSFLLSNSSTLIINCLPSLGRYNPSQNLGFSVLHRKPSWEWILSAFGTYKRPKRPRVLIIQTLDVKISKPRFCLGRDFVFHLLPLSPHSTFSIAIPMYFAHLSSYSSAPEEYISPPLFLNSHSEATSSESSFPSNFPAVPNPEPSAVPANLFVGGARKVARTKSLKAHFVVKD